MAITDYKISDAEIAAAGVQSQPNKLTGTAQQNKAVFDALVKNLVKGKLNSLIDALTGAGAAAQLGVDTVTGITADTVQEALEAIVESMQDITQGSVADGSISTAKLAPLAVTAAKIASGAVGADQIADGAVGTAKIDALAVTTAKIALLAITTALIADGAVNADKLANLAVETGKIANAAVDNTKLAENAVTGVKILDRAVSSAKIALLAVTEELIAAGAVTADKLGTGAVTASKLSGILPANVGIMVGTDTPVAANPGAGEVLLPEGMIYLQYST